MTREEQIRQKAKSYAFENDGYGYDLNTCEDIFTDGAEWMEEQMINKASHWLESAMLESAMLEDDIYGLDNIQELINEFKQAMED